jgi:hypothetical protein
MTRAVKLIASTVVLSCLLVTSIVVVSMRQRNRARAFLEDLISLQPGVSSFGHAQQLSERFGGASWNGHTKDPSCSASHCVFRIVFEGISPGFMGGKQKVTLAADVTVLEGIVVSKELDYSALSTTADSQYVYMLMDRASAPGPSGYAATRLNVDARGTPHVLKVELGSSSPTEIRRQAYAINLTCLTSFFPCEVARELFPRGFS